MASVSKRCQHKDRTRCSCNWLVRYRDASGHQREESFPASQKPAAEARKSAVQNDLLTGRQVFSRRASGETFTEFAGNWIDQHAAAESTKANYRSALRQHVGPAFGSKPLGAVTREMIRELLLTTMPAKPVGHNVIITARTLVTAGAERGRDGNGRSRRIRLPESACPTGTASVPCSPWRRMLSYSQSRASYPNRGNPRSGYSAVAVAGLARPWPVRADSVRGAELRLEEQVLGTGNLGPLKARKPGDYRDVPLPGYLARKIDDHVKTYGIAKDGYLFPMLRVAVFASVPTGMRSAGESRRQNCRNRSPVTTCGTHSPAWH